MDAGNLVSAAYFCARAIATPKVAQASALAHEAADSGLLSPELDAGIGRVMGVKQLGFRSGIG